MNKGWREAVHRCALMVSYSREHSHIGPKVPEERRGGGNQIEVGLYVLQNNTQKQTHLKNEDKEITCG